MNPSASQAILLIFDGFGIRDAADDNAITLANTPIFDQLRQTAAYGQINASDRFVGLPSGQFGNSEVGHLNIGAGRIVKQDITMIDDAIETQQFSANDELQSCFAQLAPNQTLHIMGLLSDGGVHSHQNHLYALLEAAKLANIDRIAIHAFLDGRDTPPQSANRYLSELNAKLLDYPNAKLASLCGRYFSMDRDQRWDRMEAACLLLVEGQAAFEASDPIEALNAAYARGETDEFVAPTRIGSAMPMQSGDAAIFFNFRSDRARQLTTILTDETFAAFPIRRIQWSRFACMTQYGQDYAHLPALYPPRAIHNGLGEYLAQLGKKQLRMAETEKFPHVTYFFNGGHEVPFAGEDRTMVPSPKVATYDLQPAMSAPLLTDKLIDAITSQHYDLIVCNFANGDMVGHTGNLQAAIAAVETLDVCLARIIKAVQNTPMTELILTADHGNCEQMFDAVHQQPHTQHTTEQVPFVYVGRKASIHTGGALKDIAPSLLAILGLEKPSEMTGTSLIQWD
jgi:2,3-bisphosphoglycerate-independent phosphoglycerate mutase